MPTKNKKSSKKKTSTRRASTKKTSAKTVSKKSTKVVDEDLKVVAPAEKSVKKTATNASVKQTPKKNGKVLTADVAPVTSKKSFTKPKSLTSQAIPDNIAQHDVVPLTKESKPSVAKSNATKQRRPARKKGDDYTPLASPQPLSFQRPPEHGNHIGLWIILLIVIIGGVLSAGWYYFQKEDSAAIIDFASDYGRGLEPTPEVQLPPEVPSSSVEEEVVEDVIEEKPAEDDVIVAPVHLNLEIRNGSGVPGKARQTGDLLEKSELFTVDTLANAKDYNYTGVILVNQTGKDATALEDEFPNAALLISLPEGEKPSNADVVIILGK